MKKLVLAAVFLLGFSVMAVAQDLPTVEVFGGYSLVIMDTRVALEGSIFEGMDANLNGWNGAIAINGTKHLAFLADFGGYYGTVGEEHENPRSGEWLDVSMHSIMLGPKITLYRGVASPFLQALVGYGRIKGTWAGESRSENDLAMAFGGGVDVNLNSKIALRPIQLEYFVNKSASTGNFAEHLRYSTGFVLKFGNR